MSCLKDSSYQRSSPFSVSLKQRLPINSVFCVALGLLCLLPKGKYFSRRANYRESKQCKRRMPRKKSNSINLCSAVFTNKYFIWGKKYKAVIPLTKIINAKLKESFLQDNV